MLPPVRIADTAGWTARLSCSHCCRNWSEATYSRTVWSTKFTRAADSGSGKDLLPIDQHVARGDVLIEPGLKLAETLSAIAF